VTVPEVVTHLRIGDAESEVENSLLEQYVAAATRHFEWSTGRTVPETEWELAMDRFPAERWFKLPLGFPLISVTSIKYMERDGTDITWAPSKYVVDIYLGRIAPAYGESWPSFTPYPLSAVRTRYRAGQAIASPPVLAEPGIKLCIMEMVGSMYEHRESIVLADRASIAAYAENPLTKVMMQQFKVNHAY
jgi:uncharacterized phiE125 gp8 family phage protein